MAMALNHVDNEAKLASLCVRSMILGSALASVPVPGSVVGR